VEARIEPKLITVLREGYTRSLFVRDLGAGVIVGVLALPLALAFAIASGVKPEQGLFTAIIGGFLISALSGSRVQIGGPTGAFIVIVLQRGAALRLRRPGGGHHAGRRAAGGDGAHTHGRGDQVHPVSGDGGIHGRHRADHSLLAAARFSRAHDEQRARGFHREMEGVRRGVPDVQPRGDRCGRGHGSHSRLLAKIVRKVPSPIVAIVLTTAAVHLFHIPVETIGTRFGSVPHSLPRPHIPRVDFATARQLLSPALSIALLAGIESLLSAVVADGMTGRRHRSNTELVAQGVANIASPIFAAFPSPAPLRARRPTSITAARRRSPA
jgi:SulP family sulfate permease